MKTKRFHFLINYLLKFILIVVVYYFSARLGLTLATINQNVSPVWPPTGLAIGFLYLFGNRYLPAIAIGAFLANLSIGSSLSVVIPITIGNTLEGLFGILIFHNICKKNNIFGLHTQTVAYVFSSAVSSVVSASIGVAALCVNGVVPLKVAGTVFLTWWTGDTMGGIVFAPLLIVYFGDAKENINYFKKILLIGIVGTFLSWLLFFRLEGAPFIFFLFPFVLWSAHLAGERGATFGTLLLTCIAVFSVQSGTGIFQHGSTNANLVHLQLFLTSISITGLFICDFKKINSLRAPGMVLIGGWILSGILFASFYFQSEEKAEAQMKKLVSEVELTIKSKMETNIMILQSSAGLFAAKGRVSQLEWRAFYNQLHLGVNLNGLQGIGLITRIHKDKITNFEKMIRAEGNKNFNYHVLDKNSNQEEAYVIHSLEPFEKNRQAIGLDLASEPIRKKALDLSMDSGNPIVSDAIFLVQNEQKQDAFIMAYPIYLDGIMPKNIKDRRIHLIGWAYAPVILQNFFSAIFKQKEFEKLNYSVSTSLSSSPKLLAESEEFKNSLNSKIQIHKIQMLNQTYDLKLSKSSKFIVDEDTISSWVATFSAFLTLLLSAFVVSSQLVEKKASSLAEKMTVDLKINQEIVKQQQIKLLLSAKMSSLGEMAGGIAHEINNPLTIINSKAMIMRKRLDSNEMDIEKFKYELSKIEDTSKRIAKIIKGLQTFARNTEDDPKLKIQISSVIDDTLELCKERFKNHLIDLQVNCPSNIFLECRPHQLAQVFMNLLGNAHDAIEHDNEKWIKINVIQAEDIVKLSISDSGMGISTEVLDKIMQPFFTTKEIGKGTGLGLSISKGIIEDHHGTLRYESVLGHTQFIIELPLVQPVVLADQDYKNFVG